MKYTTTNEFNQFEFEEAHISDIQIVEGRFFMLLDNVKILPDNSCNRDIRKMRANELFLKVTNGSMVSLIEEGYKLYDANGKLTREIEDREVSAEEYKVITDAFIDGMVYEIEKSVTEKNGQVQYRFVIDAANERTYTMIVLGDGDLEEWDRFLNLDSTL